MGHFLASSDEEAKKVFESEFKNNSEYNVDCLDLYRIDDKEPARRYMIEYRWRFITAPRDSGPLPMNITNQPIIAE